MYSRVLIPGLSSAGPASLGECLLLLLLLL